MKVKCTAEIPEHRNNCGRVFDVHWKEYWKTAFKYPFREKPFYCSICLDRMNESEVIHNND